MKKIVELCSVFPRSELIQSELDNVTTSVFDHSYIRPYIYTKRPVCKRYGIEINDSFIELKNEFVSNYDSIGPGEQYLLNKIFYSTNNLQFIVGGIGVGKSRFLHLFKDYIFVNRKHNSCSELCKFSKGINIYIDFNLEFDSFRGHNESLIYKDITKLICSKIGETIETFFTLYEEIMTVWDKILSNKNYNRIFSFINDELRANFARSYDEKDIINIKKIRYEIYKKIRDNKNDYLLYLSEILKYILKEYLKGYRQCYIVIFDNLDILEPLVQHTAKKILLIFFKGTPITGLVTLRQSTYRELITKHYSFPSDVSSFVGPSPLDIIMSRIDNLLTNTDDYLKTYRLTDERKNNFINSIQQIQTLLHKGIIEKFISAICGNSIRKGLILAERLINNSVYNVFNQNDIRTGDILRAIMIGKEQQYKWSSDSQIENLYDVQGYRKGQHLIKLRILRALKGKEYPNGIQLRMLLDFLTDGFGYPEELIRTSLNELMILSKRLIWSDTILHYETSNELLQAKNSYLYISSAGDLHQTWLYHNITYFQEVMLDIFVEEQDFGKGWNYGDIENRIRLILMFVNVLVNNDLKEMKKFFELYTVDDYKILWEDCHSISIDIIDGLLQDIKYIFDSIIRETRSADKKANYEHLKNEFIVSFEDLKLLAMNQIKGFINNGKCFNT